MAKWISPLLSDIRNQVAKSAVFSRWKGRSYFRSYVVPANPKTNPQKAVRAVFTELVKRMQTIMGTAAWKTAWNKRALEWLISGFNCYVMFGRKSQISCSPTSGTAPLDVTITYTCGIPLAEAKCYSFETGAEAWADITPTAGLEAGDDKTFLHSFTTAGEYDIYLATDNLDIEGEPPPDKPYAVTKWKPDKANGVAVVCHVSVTSA